MAAINFTVREGGPGYEVVVAVGEEELVLGNAASRVKALLDAAQNLHALRLNAIRAADRARSGKE